MKRILFIEDDPLLVEMCRPQLERARLDVDVAEDGLAAMRRLKQVKPDVVVLDLMVPKANGLAILMYIRSDELLKGLPVLLLHNACLSGMVAQAVLVGANTAMFRDQRIPTRLPRVIGRLLGGRTIGERHPPQDSSGEAIPEQTLADSTPGEAERQFLERTRASFLSQAAAAAASLREFWSNRTSNAPTPGGWGNLTNLYQQVHSVSLHASLAGCPRIAMLAGILEALLFELVAKPGSVGASLLRTIKQATDCLVRLLEAAVRDCADAAAPNRVLVVDDEERRNDLVVTALRRVGLQAFGTKDPDKALQMLFAEHYDVVPLDIILPGSEGSQPGDRSGSNPRSEKTPTAVNALDGHFEDRAQRVPGAGKELAAQPLNPLEVGLRTVTLYFNSKLQEAGDVPASPRSHAADCLGKGFSAGPVLVWIEPFKAGGNGGSAPMADLAPPHDAAATAILQ